MIGISTGTGVGMNALLSRALGEKEQDEANSAAKNGLFLYAMSYLAFVVLGLCFGAINGIIITKLRLNAMVVTIGM